MMEVLLLLLIIIITVNINILSQVCSWASPVRSPAAGQSCLCRQANKQASRQASSSRLFQAARRCSSRRVASAGQNRRDELLVMLMTRFLARRRWPLRPGRRQAHAQAIDGELFHRGWPGFLSLAGPPTALDLETGSAEASLCLPHLLYVPQHCGSSSKDASEGQEVACLSWSLWVGWWRWRANWSPVPAIYCLWIADSAASGLSYVFVVVSAAYSNSKELTACTNNVLINLLIY